MKYRILLVIVLTLPSLVSFAQSDNEGTAVNKFVQAYNAINQLYVEDIDGDQLVETAIKEMLKELDPHSVYLSKKEVEKANEPLTGNFEGIGIQFQLLNDTINVISPIIGGPSEKLGVMAGDKIVKVDGEDATGEKINNTWVTEHLRGPKGTMVTISVYRNGVKNLIDFEIIRDKIPIYSVDASFMINDETGYIKVSRFAATTIKEFQDGLIKLNRFGMKNLILDLRGNSGGYLNTAIELADEFLPKNKLIVYTEGKSSPKRLYEASPRGGFEEGNLIVLIDEGSASASEIVTGAVQDWDRGVVIGRRSYGKGLVQKPITLPDGAVIRLTTAKYYTPTGRSIQKPYDNGVDTYLKEVSQRYSHGEVFHVDSIHFPDSLKYTTPNGRTVFGGGGIMPDIFTPLDTSQYSTYYSQLLRKGIFNNYALEFVNANRENLLKTYPTIESFKTSFVLDSSAMGEFTAYGTQKGLEFDQSGFDVSSKVIDNYLRALIARNLYDNEAFFQILVTDDREVSKAMEVLENPLEFKRFLVVR